MELLKASYLVLYLGQLRDSPTASYWVPLKVAWWENSMGLSKDKRLVVQLGYLKVGGLVSLKELVTKEYDFELKKEPLRVPQKEMSSVSQGHKRTEAN